MSTDGQSEEAFEITPEMWKDIEKVEERWKSEQTREVKFEDVKSVVHRVCARDGHPLPEVMHADGPTECLVSFASRALDLDFPCRSSDPPNRPRPSLAEAGNRLVNDMFATLERRAAQVKPRYEHLEGPARAAEVHKIVADIHSYDMRQHAWPLGATHYCDLPPDEETAAK